jgi:hypothetical protein
VEAVAHVCGSGLALLLVHRAADRACADVANSVVLVLVVVSVGAPLAVRGRTPSALGVLVVVEPVGKTKWGVSCECQKMAASSS